MRLSKLQKYILITSLQSGGRWVARKRFSRFYKKSTAHAKEETHAKIISRSLERLIDKELMTGEGVRTPHKWYVKQVSLTRKGRVQAKKLLGDQQELPFKVKVKR
jgi:hypothetical protein